MGVWKMGVVGPRRVVLTLSGNRFSTRLGTICMASSTIRLRETECVSLIGRFIEIFSSRESIVVASTPNEARIYNGRASRGGNGILTTSVGLSTVTIYTGGRSNVIHIGSGNRTVGIISVYRLLPDRGRFNHSATVIHNIITGVTRVNCGVNKFSTMAISSIVNKDNLSSSTTFRILLNAAISCLCGSNVVNTISVTGATRCTRGIFFNGPYKLLSRVTSSINAFIAVSFRSARDPGVGGISFSFSGDNRSLYVLSANNGRDSLASSCTTMETRVRDITGTVNGGILHRVRFSSFGGTVPRLINGMGSHTLLHTFRFCGSGGEIRATISTLRDKSFRIFGATVARDNHSSFVCGRGICAPGGPARRGLSLTLYMARSVLTNGNTFHIRNNNFTKAVRTFIPGRVLTRCGRGARTVFNGNDYRILVVHPINNAHMV